MAMDYYYYDGDYDMSEGAVEDDYDFYQHVPPPHLEQEARSLAEEFRICLQPSVLQVSSYILALFGWSLLCRVLWTCCRWLYISGEWMQHLTSMLCGFGVLYFTNGHNLLIVLFLALLAYTLMLMLQYYSCSRIGVVVAVTTISSHFLYELLWNKPETWQRIRGIQMVTTMKIISLGFDLEAAGIGGGEKKTEFLQVPSLVSFLGYIFCPATCVLGPWIPYDAYLRSLRATGLSGLRWMLWSVTNAAFAVVFLCLSNCLVPLLCSDSAWKWLRIYRDALSVRCSHYFICFLSHTTLVTTGIRTAHSDAVFGSMITRPLSIEFPRSLSSLVRSWNIPMHDWLKLYIFRAVQKRFGSYVGALLCTYLVSSLLHGLHVRIYLVLLSLGCFAYTENLLRAKLANIFNACIATNPCRRPACQFTHCPSHGWRSSGAWTVLMVNLLFSLSAVLHLAYLGIVMNNTNVDEEPDALSSSLSKWSQLGYMNHWAALLTYICYLLI